MPIRLLSEQLASQIAAGEVVERPASVVKELVENALDAGATTINIDISAGGRKKIQIADNGSGIFAEEVETAFLRHATSKIETAAELEAIHTLGFRGEALAAISAVSQVTLVTRARDAQAGIRLMLDGGNVKSRETVGAPQGTVISIEQLFYNVPARLKFLKTVGTEKRLIDEFVTKYALAYPHVRFRLTHDGRISFQTTGSGEVRDVLVAVYGADIAREMLEIGEYERGDVQVAGFVAPPSLHRANRNQIVLFVNGRWVKDKNITYAIIQAYHTLLPVGRYPIAIVFVRMPLEQVDVNVHPTKTEVRFRHSGHIFSAVQRAVRETIVADSPIRHFRAGQFESLTRPQGWQGHQEQAFGRSSDLSWDQLSDPSSWSGQGQLDLSSPIIDLEPGLGAQAEDFSPEYIETEGDRLPMMRVIGQVGSSYIIGEGPDGMYLIDQHAAHERIQFEKFMDAFERQEIPSQRLVAGTAVHLPPDQATRLTDQMAVLEKLGFEIEPFGPNAFMIRAVPAVVARQDPTRVINDIIADLEVGNAPLQEKIEEKIIRRVCKTASVKAGQTLSKQEMDALVQQLERCRNPHTCPHGRPTLIYLSVAQLEREFGRA
ncbi:MAG: DNA mismatch repair endonuclease MutL [Ardenticatenaceae bacterium]|nr:DNA mismatch repair endonuclease MutL [Ardenticatenaceae bacterium]